MHSPGCDPHGDPIPTLLNEASMRPKSILGLAHIALWPLAALAAASVAPAQTYDFYPSTHGAGGGAAGPNLELPGVVP